MNDSLPDFTNSNNSVLGGHQYIYNTVTDTTHYQNSYLGGTNSSVVTGTISFTDPTLSVITTSSAYMGTKGSSFGLKNQNLVYSTSGDVVIITGTNFKTYMYPTITSWQGTIGKTFDVGSMTSLTKSTSGSKVTLTGIDFTGTLLTTASNWVGTKQQPLGFLAGDNITLSTAGNVVTFNVVNPTGTVFNAGFRGTGGLTLSTSGQVISIDSGRQLITSATCANTAAVDFTTFLNTARFTHYTLEIQDLVCVADNDPLRCSISSNAGGTWDGGAADYGHAGFGVFQSGVAEQAGLCNNATTYWKLGDSTGNYGPSKEVGAGSYYFIDFYNLGSKYQPKTFRSHHGYCNIGQIYSNLFTTSQAGIRYMTNGVQYNGIRIANVSGMKTGVLRLYGWN